MSELDKELMDTDEMNMDDTNVDDTESRKSAKIYVEKDVAYEDTKSTAYTFLLVGSLGIIFLILYGLDIINFGSEGYMKVLMILVMGILFCIFLAVGIKYQRTLKSAKAAITEEADLTKGILDWFLSNHSGASIDSEMVEVSLGSEQLYFYRYQLMKQILMQQYPNLEESYADHVIELLYDETYGDN